MAEPVEEPATTITVALCDDHGIVRSGLRRIVEAEPDMIVVGEAGSAADAVELARRAAPHVRRDSGLRTAFPHRSCSPQRNP